MGEETNTRERLNLRYHLSNDTIGDVSLDAIAQFDRICN